MSSGAQAHKLHRLGGGTTIPPHGSRLLSSPPCPTQVFEWVMCSDPAQDSHRFADMVQTQLQEHNEQPSKRFAAWEAKIRRRKAPANPLAPKRAGTGKKQGKENESSSLVALIRCGCCCWVAGFRGPAASACAAAQPGAPLAPQPRLLMQLPPLPAHGKQGQAGNWRQLFGRAGRQVRREPRRLWRGAAGRGLSRRGEKAGAAPGAEHPEMKQLCLHDALLFVSSRCCISFIHRLAAVSFKRGARGVCAPGAGGQAPSACGTAGRL